MSAPVVQDPVFPQNPKTARTIADLRTVVTTWKRDGLRVGFVPTMGALHDGHLALARHAQSLSDKVVVSIFVNPMQFAPTEDLERYPRREAEDIAKLAEVGCDLVYLPTPEIMYPADFVTRVHVDGPAMGLETDFRPQFFDGVATVVCKLFNQVMPDVAVFGEKDYQQLKVVQAFARDLDLPIEVVGLATVREMDGLALSSRNAYLKPEDRAQAIALYNALRHVRAAVVDGTDVGAAIAEATGSLTHAGFAKVDYIAVRHAETLGDPVKGEPMRILAAAWLGTTRLIDNIGV
ncbi:pantoate--beta-alanine ligase [Asticcacaulis sp. ZE23SCel15]|uniref:pantoate--beta-alanine ligase n=1 Tax=Asticcacaulis sp. ZE23SCel15 TaxID=3059027 RepID=UPI00265E73B4|nr:pantoate--beta-alanine ligase [Asticcacaulis sp. ZE23SCel15]WKL57074.1 pantoate--beta-alanine ligase [Asticcacaulis sp. ZE23SCel15]